MLSAPPASDAEQIIAWWKSLTPDWRQAFEEIYPGCTAPDETILLRTLNEIWVAPALRIVGPGGINANFSGRLHSLEGIRPLRQLEYLFVMHCGLESLSGIEGHIRLRSLYVQGNHLTEFNQIKRMAELRELFITGNQITSLKPLSHCKMLETVYCESNLITTLEGIKPYHEKHLKMFKCKPNEHLPQREIIRVQNTYGIICY